MIALDAIGLANRRSRASKCGVNPITSSCRNTEGLQVFYAAKPAAAQFAEGEKSGKQLSRHW
jgi:hypothetical protein